MYKLIAIDLDGTLLNSYGQVSERNREALKKAQEKGIQIVLASGRSTNSVKNMANELGNNNYIICGNGSLVYDLRNEDIIYDKFIEKKKALQIIKICEQNSIYYNVYTENMVIAKTLSNNVLFYHQENANKPDSRKTKINLVENIYDYIENLENENILKFTISDNSNIIFNSIIKKLRDIKNIDVLDVAHMSRKIIKSGTEEVEIAYYYTEITNENVDKWNATKWLAEKLNISNEEIIGIGDNVNDKLLIENAGLGVAMGNSAPYIKEIADRVVATNNEDGVAQIIEEITN
jgi:Cof subfamily protein (haloacid dehalogenase superfamily)